MAKRPQRITRVPRLRPRPRDAHKGQFGRVLVIGGSTGMLGAPTLCANAALRGGAGLVRIAVEGFLAGEMGPMAPCATFIPFFFSRSMWDLRDPGRRHDEPVAERQLMEVAWNVVQIAANDNDVLAVGPGWGVDPTRHFLLERLLDQTDKPLVLDADGLNNLVRLRDPLARLRSRVERGGPVVLTPHVGEMRRLLEAADSRQDPLKNREGAAAELARACGAVVVLKGAGTVVTDAARVYVNRTGNPGMATGGTGDVLTGVIAALIGQGLSPFDAAMLGVHVHGLAGDLAAKQFGTISLIAADVLAALPAAFMKLHPRR
ncbi:MAG: NAD(P)H-hydrate dehydratase [Phycisphaerae bacterium]|nr:NAD(P)H-hydrate dehydratase [Phycisphaerae bacterium]NUQ47432.1 NAD(P)H-hydrate dehydratase [Phycisphaerae bacterium]